MDLDPGSRDADLALQPKEANVLFGNCCNVINGIEEAFIFNLLRGCARSRYFIC